MRIQHNISALNTHRNLAFNNSQAAKNLEKLSSGYKINRAGDDAAGLAISEKMRAQVRGLDMASKNAQDSISLIQTAEGALNETHSILQRMRELAVQSANDTNVKDDREALQKEIDQLVEEIDRIAKTTEFNTQKLLDGSFKGTFQIGANESQTMELNVGNMGAAALGLTASTTVQTGVAAADTTKALADGVYTVSGTDLKDADGNVVGSISTNVVTANGTTYTFDKAQAVENTNSTIIVKDGEATLVTNFGDSDDAKKLSAGTYEISGTNVLKDGKVVGEFDTTNKTVKIGDVELAATDLNVLGSDSGDFQDGDQFVINGANISTREQAEGTISKIDEAIKSVSEQRATLGAVQNRLEHTINNLGTASENLTAAESRIRDTDMAKEMMEFTKNNILMQAAQAMLAQANQQPQGVLQLLQ